MDDDASFRTSLCTLLESAGLPAQGLESAEAFLESYDPSDPGCLVLDLRMPGMSGRELQDALSERGVTIPIVMVSARPDVQTAVGAMKNGAVDFFKKPCDTTALLERIREAVELDLKNRKVEARRRKAEELYARLTPREADIALRMIKGGAPKQIAFRLGLSRKTVDVHFSHIKMKLGIFSPVELVNLLQPLELVPDRDMADPNEAAAI